MKQKKLHRIISLKEMFAYIFRRSDAGMRHKLERRMQQDPFLDDAMEGLALLGEQEAVHHIENLNRGFRTDKKSSLRPLYLGMAASIALLIVAGTSLLIIDRLKPNQLALENHSEAQDETSAEIILPAAVADLQQNEDTVVATQPPLQKVSSSIPKKQNPSAIEEIIVEAEIADFTLDFESIASVEEIVVKEDTTDQTLRLSASGSLASEPQSVVIQRLSSSAANSAGSRKISGTVTDSQGNSLPGVFLSIKGTNRGAITDLNGHFQLEVPEGENVRIIASFIGMTTLELLTSEITGKPLVMHNDIAQLSEIVVIGYGSRKRAKSNLAVSSPDDRQAQPAAGFDAYHAYIRSAAILPDSATVTSVVVRVGFEISRRGRIVNPYIIGAPSPYDNKAIEIINRGPGWEAARKDGAPVEEKVIMEVEFIRDED
jgi:hypothetical protein